MTEWEPEKNLSREDKQEAANICPPVAAQSVRFVLFCRKTVSFVPSFMPLVFLSEFLFLLLLKLS